MKKGLSDDKRVVVGQSSLQQLDQNQLDQIGTGERGWLAPLDSGLGFLLR